MNDPKAPNSYSEPNQNALVAEQNSQSEELKRFFSKRVTDQVRHIMELWRLVNDQSCSQQRILELRIANEKLLRYAARFDAEAHAQIAKKIDALLSSKDVHNGTLSSEKIAQLSEHLQTLSQIALRKTDSQAESSSVITPKKPVYILLNNRDDAYKLVRQLQFFGFRCSAFERSEKFIEAVQERYPSVIVADINFKGKKHGLELVESVQKHLESPIPTLFYTEADEDVTNRLDAVRLGGYRLHQQQLDTSQVIEEIEAITNIAPPEPYRVLVVEDSKAQSFYIENMLNSAGIITKAVNDPLEIFNALHAFRAEIILMDMYLPDCDGIELAKMIRQEKRFVSIPILFLSSEDNFDIKLAAINQGGDDFLTKPIRDSHLITTIRSKAQRARELTDLMIRDSLTGLLNHTSILSVLEDEIQKANQNQLPLCFAMVDIDHFKGVNDTYGHQMGDRVIKSLSLFLKQRLRKTDAIGRYGGEEFAVVLPNTTIEDCSKIFEDIRIRFAHFTHSNNGQEMKCTFSCGIAKLTPHNASQITTQADEALYVAKNNGRNQIQIAIDSDAQYNEAAS